MYLKPKQTRSKKRIETILNTAEEIILSEGIKSIILPASTYMVFQSQSYEENDEKMIEVIQSVQKAIETYNPKLYGYKWTHDEAPRYQLSPIGDRGYIEAVPVLKI